MEMRTILNGIHVIVKVKKVVNLEMLAVEMTEIVENGWPILKVMPWDDREQGHIIGILYAVPI